MAINPDYTLEYLLKPPQTVTPRFYYIIKNGEFKDIAPEIMSQIPLHIWFKSSPYGDTAFHYALTHGHMRALLKLPAFLQNHHEALRNIQQIHFFQSTAMQMLRNNDALEDDDPAYKLLDDMKVFFSLLEKRAAYTLRNKGDKFKL